MHKHWWQPIAHFAGHTITGTLIFCIIATPAIGLSMLVHWLEKVDEVSRFTIIVLTYLEHAILIVDAVLFVVYLGFTAIHALKEMKQ